MPQSLIALCLWALAAGGVALLPMRYQRILGLGLLVLLPPLLVWVGYDAGPWFALAGFLAFVSMFRKPLRHLLRKAVGR